VCVLTREAAIDVLSALTCAPITRTIRGIRSEVEVGSAEGLFERSVINCDSIVSVPADAFDRDPVGRLTLQARIQLDQALRYALAIEY
jgi:mRNA interferase MazF